MSPPKAIDVAVIGGGIAALWTLDALDEAGYATVLFEPAALGQGQTLAAQGIIHGGLKYTLRGLFNASAAAVSEMPGRWRESLAGRRRPDLRAVRVASPSTFLWRSASWRSQLAMLGARAGLRTTPVAVPEAERPAILARAAGTLYRVDEPVLDTVSLVEAFRATHGSRLLAARDLHLAAADGGWTVTSGPLCFAARAVILAAGGHNAAVRASLGLPDRMQRRPLHMVLVRGGSQPLDTLFGHCVDGAATRVTITTHRAADGQPVWQVGGQLAERGVELDPPALVDLAVKELAAVLPAWQPRGYEWATYRVDRAELASAGERPDDAQCVVDHETLVTLWPTKLALAPRAAEQALVALRAAGVAPSGAIAIDGERPGLGLPPWETAGWRTLP